MKTFKKSDIGKTLRNGATIIDFSDDYVFALNSGAAQPFVVWRWYLNEDNQIETCSGYYWKTLSEAVNCFEEKKGGK